VHPLILFLNDPAEILHSRTVLYHFVVPQRIHRKRNSSERSFELMRHIIDEIIFYFAEFFLPYQRMHGDIKRTYNHKRKKYRPDNHPLHLLKHYGLEIWNDQYQLLIGNEVLKIATRRRLQQVNPGKVVSSIFKLL